MTSGPLAPGSWIGPYRVQRVLGQGGMGVVYAAQHGQLGRWVALKMVLGGAADEDTLQRFKREADAMSRLRHPNLVGVHDCGLHAHGPWFAMELIEGESLRQHVEQGPLPAEEACRLMEAAARGIAAAHAEGILHRDLKPDNVLVDRFGQARVTDFGLARSEGDSYEALTKTGTALGTPAYMAPEQADGDRARMGACTDVYGLGATLYHLLTGRAPFQGATMLNVLNQVFTQVPERPTSLRAELPAQLDVLVLKCLEKEPEDRYASAAELADDLSRFVAGQPIQAVPVSRWTRLRRGRSTLVAAAAVVLTLLVALPLASLVIGQQRSKSLRAQALSCLPYPRSEDVAPLESRALAQDVENLRKWPFLGSSHHLDRAEVHLRLLEGLEALDRSDREAVLEVLESEPSTYDEDLDQWAWQALRAGAVVRGWTPPRGLKVVTALDKAIEKGLQVAELRPLRALHQGKEYLEHAQAGEFQGVSPSETELRDSIDACLTRVAGRRALRSDELRLLVLMRAERGSSADMEGLLLLGEVDAPVVLTFVERMLRKEFGAALTLRWLLLASGVAVRETELEFDPEHVAWTLQAETWLRSLPGWQAAEHARARLGSRATQAAEELLRPYLRGESPSLVGAVAARLRELTLPESLRVRQRLKAELRLAFLLGVAPPKQLAEALLLTASTGDMSGVTDQDRDRGRQIRAAIISMGVLLAETAQRDQRREILAWLFSKFRYDSRVQQALLPLYRRMLAETSPVDDVGLSLSFARSLVTVIRHERSSGSDAAARIAELEALLSAVLSAPDLPASARSNALRRRAELHQIVARWAEALADLDRSAELFTPEFGHHKLRAQALINLGRERDALEAYRAFAENAYERSLHLEVAADHAWELATKLGEPELAAAVVEKALECNPELFAFRLRQAYLLQRAKDDAGMRRALQRAARAKPYGLSLTKTERERVADALERPEGLEAAVAAQRWLNGSERETALER